LLQLPMSFLFIFSFVLLHDQLRLLLLQLLICNCTTLFSSALIQTW
jgi:hypothetical protein